MYITLQTDHFSLTYENIIFRKFFSINLKNIKAI